MACAPAIIHFAFTQHATVDNVSFASMGPVPHGSCLHPHGCAELCRGFCLHHDIFTITLDEVVLCDGGGSGTRWRRALSCALVLCPLEMFQRRRHPSLDLSRNDTRVVVSYKPAPPPGSPAVSPMHANDTSKFPVPELLGTHGRLVTHDWVASSFTQHIGGVFMHHHQVSLSLPPMSRAPPLAAGA